jgi:hypothetical protein
VIEGQSDIDSVRVFTKFAEYPRSLYRRGGRPGQVDHPGNDVTQAKDEQDRDAKLAAGWSLMPIPEDVPAVDPPAAPEASPAPAAKSPLKK